MRKLATIAVLAVLLAPAALAQTAPGGNAGGGNGQFRAQFQKYQPVFDLSQEVLMLNDLDAQKGLAFTKAQAKALLPVLKDLSTRKDLKPADATKILDKLENDILTDKQLQWIDTTTLKRQDEARQRAQNRNRTGGTGGTGGGFFGGAAGAQGGARPAGTQNGQNPQGGPNAQGGPRGGMFAAISQGKPFNPFLEGRAQDGLKKLIATLSKR